MWRILYSPTLIIITMYTLESDVKLRSVVFTITAIRRDVAEQRNYDVIDVAEQRTDDVMLMMRKNKSDFVQKAGHFHDLAGRGTSGKKAGLSRQKREGWQV